MVCKILWYFYLFFIEYMVKILLKDYQNEDEPIEDNQK